MPEGDEIGQTVFRALGITPISLPIADVFTGLQTGLIETVAVNPTSAIAFQWHSSTDYMTDVPLSYLIGVLAIQKKAFNKVPEQDRKIVQEEMGKVFERLNKLNREDNQAAKIALQNQGITFVTPNPGEIEQWRRASEQSINQMLENGIISAEVVGQVRSHLQTYRNSQ